jgi:ADP-ribose pyrophosphatase
MGENVLASTTVYRGRIFNVRVDTVTFPDGRTGTREIVEYPGAVVVVALDDAEQVLLVRQYRHAVGRELLELPAGKLEPGEDPLVCARRELAEETGYAAREWQFLLEYYSTPGFTTEKMFLYRAAGLEATGPAPDSDEFIQVVKVPLGRALEMVAAGEICDAKSIVGLLVVGTGLKGPRRSA